MKAIHKKGEDGQAFIDGVIDFLEYDTKNQAGLTHHSYFNAYMDGKTNGLAGNGIQMGSENVAYKTGVLRSQNQTLLDNDIDIRDDLKNLLLDSVDQGFEGDVEKFKGYITDIAAKVYSNRDLNKSTTMTFGYGMELDSFNKFIKEHMETMAESDAELGGQLSDLANAEGRVKEELVDALHKKYIGSLAEALDPNAIKSRALMRSAAAFHAFSNELFTIESATGFELHMGGTESTGQQGKLVEAKLTKDGKQSTIDVPQYGEEATSAAVKTKTTKSGRVIHEAGGYAYGGSVPAPVQSLDAATVAMTASGKSWSKLKAKSQGKPYLHTIYDAFKVDAMGYDTVLEEVNQNWLDAGMNWSYLKETKNALASLREKWADKVGNLPDNSPVPSEIWAPVAFYLEPYTNMEGKTFPKNLRYKLSNLMEDGDKEGVAYEASKFIVKHMKTESGFDFYNPPAQPTVKQLKTFVKLMGHQLDLNNRLNKMIDITEKNKAALKAKIKADGNKVYQYYSH